MSRLNILLGILFFSASLSTPLGYAEESVALSTGVSSPSLKDAISINPAALSGQNKKEFDVFARLGGAGSTRFGAAYAGSTSSLGGGFQLSNDGTQSLGSAGLGVNLGNFQFGIGGHFNLSDFSPDYLLGLRFETGSHLVFSIILYDITNFERFFTLGFAFLNSKSVSPEFDLTFQHDSSTSTFNNVSGTAGLRLAVKPLILKLGTSFRMVPDFSFFENALEIGVFYEFNPKFAAYVIFNAPYESIFPTSETEFGIRLSL